MALKTRLSARKLTITIVAAVGMPLLGASTAAGQHYENEPPTAPSNLRVLDVTEFGVGVEFEPSTDPDEKDDYLSYYIYAQKPGEPTKVMGWPGQFRNPPPDDLVISGRATRLEPGTTYTITVEASDRFARHSEPSNPVTITTRPVDPPLPVPTNLRVTRNETGTELSLAWDVAEDPRVVGHVAYINGEWLRQVFPDQKSVTARNLTPETEYVFTVRSLYWAQDGAYQGEPSEELRVTTSPDTVAPSTPRGVSVIGRTGTSITVTWGSAADNHKVAEYLLSNGSDTKVIPVSESQTFEFTGLAPETSYTFEVRARDAAGNVSGATTVEFATGVHPDTEPPTPVTGLEGFAVLDAGEIYAFEVLWNRSTDNVTLQRQLRYRVTFEDGGTILLPEDQTFLGDRAGVPSGCIPTVQAVDAAGNHSEPRSIDICANSH